MAFTEDLHRRKDGTPKPNAGTGMRWRVVWNDGGRRRTKSFKNKTAAERWRAHIEHQQHSGTYVSQDSQRALVGDLLPLWEASLIRLKPSTRKHLRSYISATLEPRWGSARVGGVTRRDVQSWVNEMHAEGQAARTVDTKYGKLRAFYSWAVQEGYVSVSPCQKITTPRGHGREHTFLTPAQVRDLLEHMHPHHRPLVEFLFTTGARFGEACELRVKDLDLDARRASIARSYTNGAVTLPKSHKRRTVPLTGRMADVLRQTTAGKDREDLVFTTTRGNRTTIDNFRALYWVPAVKASGVPESLNIHAARHTAASLATSSGANVKVVQRMLGHASASLTLDLYSGLFASDMDDVAERMGNLLE